MVDGDLLSISGAKYTREIQCELPKISEKTTPTFPRDKVVLWEDHFHFTGRKYRHFHLCAVISSDIGFSLLGVADTVCVSEVQKIGRFH